MSMKSPCIWSRIPLSCAIRSGHSLQVLEQNYRADPVSQISLLALYEGRTIDFEQPDHSLIKGKVIRSGYVRPDYFNPNNYGAGAEEPIIEVGGQLRFGLPGIPIFPDDRRDYFEAAARVADSNG